jgi:hypothetical protein
MADLKDFQPARNTAVTAGGKVVDTLGAGAAPQVCMGSGAPTLSAAQGSLYLRTDGTGVADRAYINTDGGTTWTAISTAA